MKSSQVYKLEVEGQDAMWGTGSFEESENSSLLGLLQ